MQKVYFSIVFNSLIITSSFVFSSYFGDLAKKDRKSIEDSLSYMRQKYFENQNFLENDIQVIPVGQKVKIVGLDKVTDHIDASIQASTNFQVHSLEVLDEYCKGQNYEVTSHINKIISGLKKRVPKEFHSKNNQDLIDIEQKLQNLKLEENREFFKKNQKQKDLLIGTALGTVSFSLFAIKAHEKEIGLLTKIIGLFYLKFLWDKGTCFYQEDLNFQEKLAKISLRNIACEVRKDELNVNSKLKPAIEEELESYRQNKVKLLDEKLAEYRSQELERIPLILFSTLKEKEKSIRKKIMESRKTKVQRLFTEHQNLTSKILSEKEENSTLTVEPDKSEGNVVITIFSKITNLFGF